MDIDPPPPSSSSSQTQSSKEKAEALITLTTGQLSSSLSKVSSFSKSIPSDKEFHFFVNFKEFKLPIKEIDSKSQSLLETIGAKSDLWVKKMNCPKDVDDAYDWLVDLNDEVIERFDMSVDEFEKLRKEEEKVGGAGTSGMESNGFQLVGGKSKKNKGLSDFVVERDEGQRHDLSQSGVKVATRDKKTVGGKQRVPFHIPTIPRPQDQYKILVNNSNQPFQHVWLQRSEDGSRFIHPLEIHSASDFVDRSIGDVEPVKPPSFGCTPFKLVEDVKDLKEMAVKLRAVDEFAVDLEHNQYRSFQGLTCLMQISTRTEDFVVDTLKLRIHVGPYLREVFKDPTKRKVMHGADRDIIWLQRDFGIYICNMFDTGQASRVLKLERNSLEYLLHHFCEVAANKEYQNADWRLRPLPDEMIKYAREDTHYLLYIYDLMKIKLLSMPKESENSDDPLLEVYKRSYDICMQLYEKEILTDDSYLHIYGLQAANFHAQQLSVVAGLCEWRDVIARAEDESTGFVLPNKSLLEIAKQMPVTVSKLRHLVKSKHPYVERSIGSVVSIIRHSITNSSTFEAIAQRLREERMELASGETGAADGSSMLQNTNNGSIAGQMAGSESVDDEPMEVAVLGTEDHINGQRGSEHLQEGAKVKNGRDGSVPSAPGLNFTIPKSMNNTDADTSSSEAAKVTGVTIQMLKKPSRGFGAMLGNTAQKKKVELGTKDKEVSKLEQIKSTVILPFHSFSGKDEPSKSIAEECPKASAVPPQDDQQVISPSGVIVEDVIPLEGDESDGEEPKEAESESADKNPENDEDEPMSLCDLSSSFQKCLQSSNQVRKLKQDGTSQQPGGLFQLKPFDYEAARKQVRFGENVQDDNFAHGNDGGIHPRLSRKGGQKGSSNKARVQREDESGGFALGKRRQAFPASGNRSATFRSG